MNIIGIGEILWDLLPDGKQLGGAPANFAYVSKALGNSGAVLSRVGQDKFGKEILEELKKKNLSGDFVQIDAKNQTGIVNVEFVSGQPVYEIVKPAAWDFLELSADWRALAVKTDAVCFGSLAQRSEGARRTILEFVNLTRKLRIFDVNLRQDFFSRKVLQKSMNLANIVKLNAEELPVVAEMFEIKSSNQIEAAKGLLVKFGLKMVCITRGAAGCLLISKRQVSENAGFKTKVKDTIGAGDAFTAAMTHGLLRGWELDKINEFASRVGAFVASQTGAMPVFPEEFLQS